MHQALGAPDGRLTFATGHFAPLPSAAQPERMLESASNRTVGQKIWGTVGHSCSRFIIVISWNYHLHWLLSN